MNLFKKILIQSKDIFFLDMKNIILLSVFCLLIVYQLTNVFNAFLKMIVENPIFNGSVDLNKILQSSDIIKFIFIALGILFLAFLVLALIQYFFTASFLSILKKPNESLILIVKNNLKRLPKILGFIFIETILISLGIVFFIIPGIFLYFVFFFAFAIMITENKGIFQSIAQGFVFFKKQIWKVLPAILILKIFVILLHPASQWLGLGGLALIANLYLSATFAYFLLNKNHTQILIDNKDSEEN